MQESLHVFFSIFLSVLLFQINAKASNKGHIIAYVFVILLAGLFRGLWFFWLIGLIPLAKNKLQHRLFYLLFVL